MHRECPVCRVPLQALKLKNRVEIDVCLHCRGIWFDKGELTQTHAQGRMPEKFMQHIPASHSRDQVVCSSCGTSNARSKTRCGQCGTPLEFLCPECQIQLEEARIGEVTIDRCRACQGVWLDGGELALLFDEFKRRKQQEVRRVRHEGGDVAGELATWAALDALDLLIWRPDIVYHAGDALADVVTDIPGAVVGGAGAVLEGIGNIPEYAGDLAEGAVDLASGAADMAGDLAGGALDLASGAADMAGDLVGGALDLAGELPELAGSVAEAGASFLELLFDLIGSIFDN